MRALSPLIVADRLFLNADFIIPDNNIAASGTEKSNYGPCLFIAVVECPLIVQSHRSGTLPEGPQWVVFCL